MEDIFEIKNGIYTESGTLICEKYDRILTSEKISYIEIENEDLILENFHVDKENLFRFTDPYVYRIKFISNDTSKTPCFYQTKLVKYMDFKMGYFYVECEKLFDINGICCKLNVTGNIKKSTNENIKKFFE